MSMSKEETKEVKEEIKAPKLVDEDEDEEEVEAEPQTNEGNKDENQVKKPPFSKEKRIKELNDQKKRNEKRLEKGKRYLGLVKSVISGDAVKLIPIEDLKKMNIKENLSKKNPIPELTLYLHGVRAPQLRKKVEVEGEEGGDEDTEKTEQEPFAWDSRDYLRKRLIGKTVIYRVESKLPSKDEGKIKKPARGYGEIYLLEGGELVNIIHEAISKGWLFVSVNKNFERLLEDKESAKAISVKEYKLLKDLEAEAMNQGLGAHTTSDTKKQASLRYVHRIYPSVSNKTSFELFEKLKNLPLHGVVEQVRNGSTLRVIILDRMDEITVMLGGIRCPDYFYRTDQFKTTQKYALEAKYFTEHYLLNRDVEVNIDKLDDSNNFYGSVRLVDNPQFDITIELLKAGLATFIEWSVCKGVDPTELKAIEEQAKKVALKIWKSPSNLNTPSEGMKKNNPDITGKVIEVVSGGAIKVLPVGGGKKKEPVFVRLSSIKAPRMVSENDLNLPSLNDQDRKERIERFNEDKANNVYAFEAKEFLRKKLIGQTVTCVYDYMYDKTNKYYTVYQKDSNIAVELLENGYGRVMTHYDDEPRSREYQKLIYAQNKAAKSNKGIHRPTSDKPQLHIKDFTSSSDFARAQLYLSNLKSKERVPAVIEQVIGSSRFKVWVPSENVTIILSLHGVFCEIPKKNPQINEEDTRRTIYDMYPIEEDENKGFHYVREKLYQRDVEIAINDVDKRSKFRGRVYFQGEDIAIDLLEQGYAKVNDDTAHGMDEYKAYKEAENKAKFHKDGPKGMWKDYDPEKEKEEENQRKIKREENKKEREKTCKCTITEIIDGSNFYFQILGEETERLEKMMMDIHNANLDSLPPYAAQKDELVLAKYSDGKYYRARVKEFNEVYTVFFIDYGNSDDFKIDNIRKLDLNKFGTKELPPQAQLGRLAYVKCPSFDDEFGEQAADLFHDLVYEQECIAKYWWDFRNNINCLKLGVPSKKIFVNITMVTEGLARVTRSKTDDPVYQSIQEEERNAQKSNIGMWVYGTGSVADSDEEKEIAQERKKLNKKNEKKKEKKLGSDKLPPEESKEKVNE